MDIFNFALRSCMGGRDMIQLSFPKASSVAFWCMSTSSLSVRFSIGSSLRGSSLIASSYPSPALSRVAHGMASLVSIFSFLDSKRRRKPSLERPAAWGSARGGCSQEPSQTLFWLVSSSKKHPQSVPDALGERAWSRRHDGRGVPE